MSQPWTGFSAAIALLLVLPGSTGAGISVAPPQIVNTGSVDSHAIRPYDTNPFYWQYRGEPVLLVGGSGQDNLFNHPDLPPDGLEAHLDLLVASGGNYLRTTLSSRDEGNLWPFHQEANGNFDLGAWNDEYWIRFSGFLEMTHAREIILQIELWDPWDLYDAVWARNPWNPANNINYSTENTILETSYEPPHYADGTSFGTLHDFFLSVPSLENDRLVLSYQSAFVAKVLSYTLSYDHIIYCITNEIHPQYSPEWGRFWRSILAEHASSRNKSIFISEMFWQPDMTHQQHRESLDTPKIYHYFEASQNSATLDPEEHWEDLMFVRSALTSHPRPINHTKIYGADTGPGWAGSSRNAVEKFWRNIFAGSASARFHRPPAGLGLSELAQASLRSIRMVGNEIDVFRSEPRNDLLSGRGTNEAYLYAEPGVSYAVYFPDEGSVTVDLTGATGELSARWLNIESAEWIHEESPSTSDSLTLRTPGKGHQVAIISASN